jgi:hypothetical protein
VHTPHTHLASDLHSSYSVKTLPNKHYCSTPKSFPLPLSHTLSVPLHTSFSLAWAFAPLALSIHPYTLHLPPDSDPPLLSRISESRHSDLVMDQVGTPLSPTFDLQWCLSSCAGHGRCSDSFAHCTLIHLQPEARRAVESNSALMTAVPVKRQAAAPEVYTVKRPCGTTQLTDILLPDFISL